MHTHTHTHTKNIIDAAARSSSWTWKRSDASPFIVSIWSSWCACERIHSTHDCTHHTHAQSDTHNSHDAINFIEIIQKCMHKWLCADADVFWILYYRFFFSCVPYFIDVLVWLPDAVFIAGIWSGSAHFGWRPSGADRMRLRKRANKWLHSNDFVVVNYTIILIWMYWFKTF